MIEDIKGYYRQRFATHGISPASVQHVSRDDQEMRFKLLTAFLADDGVLVDVGCGLGDMLQYLRASGFKGRYVGLDFLEEFVAAARERFNTDPHALFEIYDVLGDHGLPACDVAFQSGVFNNALPPEENWHLLTTCIAKMARSARKGFAFNCLSTHVEYRDPTLWYADPGEVLAFTRQHAAYVSLRQDYVFKANGYPYEFTVYGSHDAVDAGYRPK